MQLSEEEKVRYSRQTKVEGIGQEGQARLLSSHVFIIGCGALGSMVAMQLAAAGVGEISIADFDTIDVSNLQRQFFFSTDSCGRRKADELRARMLAINPNVKVNVYPQMVTRKNAMQLFEDVDFVIDGSDNPDTKYMTEQVCKELGKPCCVAGVSGWSGQVMTILPGTSLFSEYVPQGDSAGFTPCSIGGVMGPAAAVAASFQASEAIKYLSGSYLNQSSELLTDKLLCFDIAKNQYSVIR